MRKSGYTYVQWGSAWITVYSTDSELLDWVAGELKRLIPEANVTSRKMSLPAQGRYYLEVEKPATAEVEGDQYWVLRELGLRGWEVLSVEGDNRGWHLRYVGEETD